MPLSPKEAFKAGFLARCEEEGLDAAVITERIKSAQAICADVTQPATPEEDALIKQALQPFQALVDGLKWFGTAGLKGIPLALGTGAVVGAGGGMLAGKVRNAFDPQVSADKPPGEVLDVQAAEMVSALNREAAAARRRTAMLKRKREREEEDANRWSRI